MRLNRIHCADDLVVQQDELIFIRGTQSSDVIALMRLLSSVRRFSILLLTLVIAFAFSVTSCGVTFKILAIVFASFLLSKI